MNRGNGKDVLTKKAACMYLIIIWQTILVIPK